MTALYSRAYDMSVLLMVADDLCPECLRDELQRLLTKCFDIIPTDYYMNVNPSAD